MLYNLFTNFVDLPCQCMRYYLRYSSLWKQLAYTRVFNMRIVD